MPICLLEGVRNLENPKKSHADPENPHVGHVENMQLNIQHPELETKAQTRPDQTRSLTTNHHVVQKSGVY